MAGYPIGFFYGYKVDGVYQSQADIDASPKNTLATVTPGDLKFADVNGDGEITPADRTLIGDPTPDVTYGISLGVSYKGWELGIDMMGQGGNRFTVLGTITIGLQSTIWSSVWTVGTAKVHPIHNLS